MKKKSIYIIGVFNGAQLLAGGIALYTHEAMWAPAIIFSAVVCGAVIAVSEHL